jgi:hypothetical protein
VVGLPEVAVAVVLLGIDDVVVAPFLQPQAELVDSPGDDRRAADQRRPRQALVDASGKIGASHPLALWCNRVL